MNKVKNTFMKFLKPTKAKIILTSVIFVIFVPFLIPHEIVCITAPCPELGLQSMLTQFLFNLGPVVGINYVNLFGGLVVSYLSLSLAIFLINKVRRNRNAN